MAERSDKHATTSDTSQRPCCLTPFDVLHAPQIAAWVRSEEELAWLAPGTPPPLTTE
jgi:hypothetical protein